MATPVTFADIQAAAQRIAGAVVDTPCPVSLPLSEVTGSKIYCKLEYLQRTGSFKERGARNALLSLSNEQRQRGVIAASAGNHALGVAYHAQLLQIPATVVMPRFAPLTLFADEIHERFQAAVEGAPTAAAFSLYRLCVANEF